MRYTLLIYTNEADRPQWGTPEGDTEAKGYDDFHGEVTTRGVFRAGEPLQQGDLPAARLGPVETNSHMHDERLRPVDGLPDNGRRSDLIPKR